MILLLLGLRICSMDWKHMFDLCDATVNSNCILSKSLVTNVMKMLSMLVELMQCETCASYKFERSVLTGYCSPLVNARSK